MSGRLIGAFIVVCGLAAGVAVYYLQVYAFYDRVPAEAVEIRLTSVVSGAPEPVPADGVQAIDANSSPLRFRACFTVGMSLAALTEEFVLYDGAEPLTAPGWFECFDAVAVGTALEAGAALAFLAEENIRPGVDRVVAVHDDGRAFAWHQLNDTLE